MRKVIAIIEIDDDNAIKKDMGTLDYLEREFNYLSDSGVFLRNARILDYDDKYDTEAIEAANKIFEGEL